MQNTVESLQEEKSPPRLTLSLPPIQNDALNDMVQATGLSKTELIRQAVALLNVSMRARKKGLSLALANEEDEVVMKIASTI